MKKRKKYEIFIEIILTVISAFIYALAFPSFLNDKGYPFLAFVALIPMLFALNRTRFRYSFLLGAIFGGTFLAVFNYWLSTFHPLAIFIGPSIRAIQLFFLFPLFKLAYILPKKHKVLYQASAYALYTFIIQLGFLAYPYGNLASALVSYLPVIQIASITGQWFLSFFFIIPQIFIADYFIRFSYKSFYVFLEEQVKPILIYFVILIGILIFGFKTITYYENIEPSSYVKIATIQHNSDTWKGGYQQYKNNFEVMKKLTLQAMESDPDMVIWSETAFVPSVSWHTKYPSSRLTSKLVDDFVEFGKNLDVPLITGNPEGVLKEGATEPFDDDGNWNRDDYNSVILFADGKLLDTYRKQHLVPFTEYFPYEKQFPKFYAFLKAHDYHWWLPGEESKVFNYNQLKFSTSICFEDIFEDISRNFVKDGSSLLLNLSNDSWSRAVSAEMQHMDLGVLRTVENRRSAVRSTNSGMTCLILPTGKVIEPITPFTEDYRIYKVPIYTEKDFGLTFYTKYGNWFIYLLAVLQISWLIKYIVDYIKKRNNKTLL